MMRGSRAKALWKSQQLSKTPVARSNSMLNVQKSTQLVGLQDVENAISIKIQDAGDTIELRKARVRELEKELENARKNVSKASTGKNSAELQRISKQLNYQLQQTIQRHNQATARRKILRKEIDALRLELAIFQGVGRNINRSMSMEEKENRDAQEALDLMMRERRDKEQQLFKMKQTVFYEKKAFDKNNHDILKILDVDNNVLLKEPETGRNSVQFRGSARTNNLEQKAPASPTISETSFQSKQKRQRMKRTLTSEKTLEEIEKELQEISTMMSKLKEKTQLEDLEQIKEKFQRMEEDNNRLFAFVNNQEAEIEGLLRVRDKLDKEIKTYLDPTNEIDATKEKLMKEMRDELKEKSEKVEKSIELRDKLNLKIGALKVGIPNIIKRISSEEESTEDLRGITLMSDAKMLQYLAVIERRTNEILQMYDACQGKTKDGKKSEREDIGSDTGVKQEDPEIIEKLITRASQFMSDKDKNNYYDERDLKELRKELKNYLKATLEETRSRGQNRKLKK